jgi:hypothetical protein
MSRGEGSMTTAKVYYIHNDALGGANILSNASGTGAGVLDYYPFGRDHIGWAINKAWSARALVCRQGLSVLTKHKRHS